jgi:hypothetical protein
MQDVVAVAAIVSTPAPAPGGDMAGSTHKARAALDALE